jgi:hypothetical protein
MPWACFTLMPRRVSTNVDSSLPRGAPPKTRNSVDERSYLSTSGLLAMKSIVGGAMCAVRI